MSSAPHQKSRIDVVGDEIVHWVRDCTGTAIAQTRSALLQTNERVGRSAETLSKTKKSQGFQDGRALGSAPCAATGYVVTILGGDR